VKLYGYWRSSATWRVRIALNFKDIPYEYIPVHLVQDGGEHRTDWYQVLNPSQQVPTLEVELAGHTRHLGQSLAVLEFLEEFKPTPAMLPTDLYLRSRTRQLAEIVNSGIQPLQNLSVLNHLKTLKVDSAAWSRKWISQGLTAFQTVAEETAGTFSVGNSPTWADACLIPQLYNARRFSIDLKPFARLVEIESVCAELESFKRAHADAQPDAQP
jgi:maleylpyruvate isomerase